MPGALDLLNGAITLIGNLFGTVEVSIEGEPEKITVDWNSLGRTEVIELAGKRVSFSCTLEARKNQFTKEPKQGLRVTRIDTGAVFRIVGSINGDDLTYRMALDSINK